MLQFIHVFLASNPNALQNIGIRNSEGEAQASVFSEAFQVTPVCSPVKNQGSGLEPYSRERELLASASPRSLLEMQVPDPTPDLLSPVPLLGKIPE